jgi:hypothetical protein
LPRLGLLRRFELGAELVEMAMHGLDLIVHQADARQQQTNVAARGLGGAGRHRQRLLAQNVEHMCRVQAADAVLGKDALDRGLAQLGGLGRRRRLMPQRQEPRRGQVGAGELERLGIVAPQLLAQPIAQAVQLPDPCAASRRAPGYPGCRPWRRRR